MYNTYLTSRISLSSSTRAAHPFHDYPSFSPPSCCCYCSCYTSTMMYKTPTTPSYCYNLYGLRQSSLIQCRKLISGGYYTRLPVSNVDRSCTCDRICAFRGKSAGGGRKVGSRKCMMSFEDRSESCDFDEAEVLLSLLSEGIGEEKSFRVGKETKRWIKKEPVMEKRESGGGSEKKCGGKKKRIVIDIIEGEPSCECEYESVGFGSRIKDNRRRERVRRRDEGKWGEEMVDVSDGEPSCEYESLVSGLRNKDNRRGERIRRKEETEALSREENRNAVLRENKESLLSKQAKREREERVLLFRKARPKDEEKQEGEFMSRKENWKVMAKKEDREDLSRREEHRNRMRKDGSSCSSYYSVSSTGDYGSDDEIDLGEGRYMEESSSGYKRNSRNSEEDQRYEGHREDHCVSLINKSNAKGSSVVESDFRKKSEKKLADVSVEEIEPRKETTGNHSKFLMDHDSKYHGKTYDYYVGYDDRKVKSNESMEVEERRELNRQTGDDSRQYKQFVEMQDNRSHPRNSPKVASSSQETVGERRTAVGLGRDDEYHQRNSHRVAEVSEIQEIDRRKTYISQQDIDITKTEISREEIETNIMKQHNRSDDVSYSYGSRRVNSDKNDVPAEVASVSHETVGAHQAAVGYGSRDDDYYRRNSDKMAAVSEIQEIDLRKTSVSQQETDFRKTSVSQQETDFRKTSVSQQGTGTRFEKKKGNSTNILSSINDDARNQQSRGKSQQLAIKEGTSVSKRKLDDKRVKQEQNVDLAYGSSLESKEQHSLTYAKRADSSRNESNELTKTTITRPADFVAVDIEDRNKTKSNILLRLPSSALPVESNSGSISNKVSYGGLQFGSTAHNLEESQEQPTKFLSHEDAIGSAARQEKFSARYVDSFVDKVKNEILSSEIQGEKKTNETKNVGEEQQGQTSSAQTSSGDSKSRHSTTKGPSDEMWDVDEPSVKPEVQDDDASGGVVVKRSGRSIWNVIADIVHLRWSARPEGHSSGRRTGGRSSPIQSMSSETWFSGHEAEEHVEVARDKEEGNTTQGGRQEEKTRLQVEEGSSLSRAEGRLKPVGSNAPSSSSAAIVDSSTPSPAHKLHRSPVVKRDSEGGEARISASGTNEQLNTGSIDQPESSVSKGELKQRKLGRKDQIASERFEEWEEAYRLEAEHLKIDEMFMREALVEAKKAADNWEVPVGAVLVQNGKIIARGCNLVEELRDSTAHAEMICIREASNALRTWRLSDTTLYVTLEPCPMCAGAILQARIDTVVWGAPNKLLGADGSWIRLFPSGDGNELEQSDKPPAPIHPFHPKIVIRRRVLASECADAMQQFFQLRRKKKDNQPDPPGTSPSCLPISHHHPSKFLTKMHNAFHLMFCL